MTKYIQFSLKFLINFATEKEWVQNIKTYGYNFWYIFNILDSNFCYPASKSTTGKKKTFKEMESRRD